MAVFNTKFYQGESDYSDGDIEEDLLRYAQSGKDSREILASDDRWPVIYHFSELRANILNWYEFGKEPSILEVGSGCGALTGMLCGKAKRVVSVELTQRRASVNFARNGKFDNLEIIVGNFNNIVFSEKFDYIILNGVLEYARLYTKTESPYRDFLKKMKTLLKEGGKILIAIENRIGTKYLAGAREDHTGIFFDGVNGYPSEGEARTFSKEELRQIICSAGLHVCKFYYPYPDYKFPEVIYTDESLSLIGRGEGSAAYDANRLKTFDEAEFNRILIKEKIAGEFANSFLVEVTEGRSDEDSGILYVKMNNDRDRRFQIETRMVRRDGGLVIQKYAANEEAQGHLERMMILGKVYETETLKYHPIQKHGRYYEYPYLYGKTLEMHICALLTEGRKEEALHCLERLLSELEGQGQFEEYATEDFQKVFGREEVTKEKCLCVDRANIDLLLDNIIIENGKYIVIDYEWLFDFAVPVKFLKWRILQQLYTRNKEVQDYISEEELYSLGKIDAEDIEAYQKWIRYFSESYVSYHAMDRYRKREIAIAQLVEKELSLQTFETSVYIDAGEGYSEDFRVVREISNTAVARLEVDLSQYSCIKRIRWDPIENKLCKCTFEAYLGGQKLHVERTTVGCWREGAVYFFTTDPQVEFRVEGSAGKLEIAFTIEEIKAEEIEQMYMSQYEGRIRAEWERRQFKEEAELQKNRAWESANAYEKLNAEYMRVRTEKEQREEELSVLYHSTSWKVTKPLRGIASIFRRKM